ncbi:SPFH domain-containing protein [Actinomadura soli]|nr:SPFH domain-containing protein [Actinomadura soli]
MGEEAGTMTLIVIAAVAAALAASAYLGYAGFVRIPPDHVGIVRRRFGRGDAGFPGIGSQGRPGLLARTIPPGNGFWGFPGVYSVQIVPRVVIPPGHVGLVTALFGRPRPAGQALGRAVSCDDFQAGERFLAEGGELGRQAAVLPGDATYSINTALFDVETVPAVRVRPGTIGLVVALMGRIRPADRPFARHVECDEFRDAAAFLERGGEQGRQLAVLVSGVYEINPWVFHVITTSTLTDADGLAPEHLKEVVVHVGTTGVVVTLDGREPTDGELGPEVPGHHAFQRPWVFLENGGVRGVQKEVLREGGIYALNPWFVRVVMIPSRVLVLEWRARRPDEGVTFDADLDEIGLVIEGYALRVEMTQSLRVPTAAAPHLVRAFGTTTGLGGTVSGSGTLRRFVQLVLAAAVSTYFGRVAADARITDFLSRQSDIQLDLADDIRAALSTWNVEAINTHIGFPTIEDPKLAETLRQIAGDRVDLEALELRRSQEVFKSEIEEMRIRAEQRRMTIELETEINLLGVDNVVLARLVRELARMDVPKFMEQEDADHLAHLPAELIAQLLERLREMRQSRDDPPQPPADDPAEGTT